MENKTITKHFRLAVQLMELHEAPVARLRPFQNVVIALENTEEPLAGKSTEELMLIEGIGKGMAARITDLVTRGSFADLDQLLADTPQGLLDVLKVKGIGPRKVRILWKDLGIDDLHKLMEACQTGKVAAMKGFGAKTQQNIQEAIAYQLEQEGKHLYAEIEPVAIALQQALSGIDGVELVALTGDYRRSAEVIDKLELLVATTKQAAVTGLLSGHELLVHEQAASGPFIWRGRSTVTATPVEIRFCTPAKFGAKLIEFTGSVAHINHPLPGGKTLMSYARQSNGKSENDIYFEAGLAYVDPEMREGLGEIELALKDKLPPLIEDKHLLGILHNHSTYSDGANTLAQMAQTCRDMGYQYFGIADHSKSAFYARGLNEYDIKRQHEEIERLNSEMAPFRILKGIESDILNDGSLDYADEVLATFDYVVASVHSPLNMDIVKATDRLIKAVSNPFTTILGHPTGRLLLRRQGYPIDHKAVIDACAEHGVVIEINANPRRLDINWRWIPYCLEKGVKISINPDAHSVAGLLDMRYGVLSARKGGLTREMTLNALSLNELEGYFKSRREKVKALLS